MPTTSTTYPILSLILIIYLTAVKASNETNSYDLIQLSRNHSLAYVDSLLRGQEQSDGGYLCHDGLVKFKNDLDNHRDNAKQMVDYSARIPTQEDFNLIDFGFYRECLEVKNSAYCVITGNKRADLIPKTGGTDKNSSDDYLIDLNRHINISRRASLVLGLCLPGSCVGPDVEKLFQNALNATKLEINLDRCEKHDDIIKLTRYDVIALAYLGLILISHLLGPFTSKKKPLSAFNLRQNWNFFRSDLPRSPEDQVTCIYGLKAISMFAIIVGNLQYLAYIPSKHGPNDANSSADGRSYPFIGSPINGYLYLMDTFFVISGFLAFRAARVRLRGVKANKIIFARAFRHSAVITATIALYFACFNGMVKERLAGPLWESLYGARGVLSACQDHWWSDMLMIDIWRFNYNHCTLSSWYLIIDLVCFASSLHLVIPWLEMRIVMIIMTVLSFGSGIIAAGFALYKLNYPPTIVANQLFTPGYFDFINIFLSKPWIHGVCYMIGILLAFHMRKERPALSKLKQRFYCLLTIGFFVMFHYMESSWSQSNQHKKGLSVLYGTTIRLLWALVFGWIIFATHTQSLLAWLNRLLSRPFFRRISKLNMSLLLSNFLVIRLRNAVQEFPVKMTPIDWILYHLLPNIIIIYVLALILTLTIEIPSTRAVKIASGVPERGGTGRILTRPQVYSDFKVVNNTLSQNVDKQPNSLRTTEPAFHSVKF